MRRAPMIRRLAAAATAALIGLTAGCAGDASPLPPDLIDQVGPTGAPTPSPGTSGAAAACDPRASLRPAGALPQPGHMPAGTYMAEIQRRGRLILGTSQDTKLFSSRNPFTGRIEGFDVDMARQVALAIFGDPATVDSRLDIRVVAYSDRLAKIVRGPGTAAEPRDGVDLVADTMTATCERATQVSFSTIYYEAGQRVLVSKNSTAQRLADLKDQKVCAADGSTSYENLVKDGTVVPVKMPAFGDCMVAFQRNEIAAVSTDDTILAGMLAQDPFAKIVGPKFTEEPYGMAMSKEHPEFTQFVNAVLDRERADGTWAKTYAKWLTALGTTAPQPPAAVYR
jgi:polar amino acid transport system substrate-binding protein